MDNTWHVMQDYQRKQGTVVGFGKEELRYVGKETGMKAERG